jgi:glycosyltransferase involved in cell wall biosynthesis
VDDGTDPVKELFRDIPGVVYHQYTEKMTLGTKRNLMHSFTRGDIIVYMDDDDWYPPDRVAHAVQTLLESPNALCSGSSEIYVYNTSESQLYQLGPYGPNHATAGTFAFKRELLNITKYDDKDAIAEESAFLKNHTIPFVQLNPIYTIVVFTHDHNSFDKRILLKNEGQVVTLTDETGKTHEKMFVQKSTKSLDLFFPTAKDKQLRAFYLSLESRLKDYDAGLVKHKPDVVKQTNDIFMNRTLNAPILDIMMNGENRKMSINNLVEIIQNLNQQLQQQHTQLQQQQQQNEQLNATLTQLKANKTTNPLQHQLQQQSQMHPLSTQPNAIMVLIPGMGESKSLTGEQVNELVAIQNAEIVKLTNRLARCTKLDPAFFYLLDSNIV